MWNHTYHPFSGITVYGFGLVVVLWYDMCDFKSYLFLIMRLIRYFSLPLKISFALREKTNFQSNVKFFAIVVESEQCINLDIVIHF